MENLLEVEEHGLPRGHVIHVTMLLPGSVFPGAAGKVTAVLATGETFTDSVLLGSDPSRWGARFLRSARAERQPRARCPRACDMTIPLSHWTCDSVKPPQWSVEPSDPLADETVSRTTTPQPRHHPNEGHSFITPNEGQGKANQPLCDVLCLASRRWFYCPYEYPDNPRCMYGMYTYIGDHLGWFQGSMYICCMLHMLVPWSIFTIHPGSVAWVASNGLVQRGWLGG